jgi:hypothetical protein
MAVVVVAAAVIGVLVWRSGGGSTTYATVPTCADVQAKNPGLPPLTTTQRRAQPSRNQIVLCVSPDVVVQININRGGGYTASGGPCPHGSDGPACARVEFTALTSALSPHPLGGLPGADRASYGLRPHCWAIAVKRNALLYMQYNSIDELDQCHTQASVIMPGLLRTLGP